jgi:MFS family permease
MRFAYFAVLAAAVACYAALGAVLGSLSHLVDDRALLGLAVGAPALTGILTRPAGGRLADRVGPAPVVLGGAVVMTCGLAPMALSHGYLALLGSRLIVGAGEGAMMAAAVLWLLRLAGPERRGRAMGHIGLANYGGLTAGPPLAALLGYDRTPVLIAAAVLPLAGAALVSRLERPEPAPAGQEDGGVLSATLVPGISLTLVNIGYVALLAFGSTTTVPIFAAGVILTRTLGGSLPDRLGGTRTAFVSTAIAAVGLAIVALGPAIPGAALLAVGQGLAVPSLGLLALRRVPQERHGAAAGMFFAFFDAGVGGGGPLVGLIARAASPPTALLTSAIAVFAAGLLAVAKQT